MKLPIIISNHLKNVNSISILLGSNSRIHHKHQLGKYLSTSIISRNIDVTEPQIKQLQQQQQKVELKPHDFEKLWLEQDAKMRTNFSQDEFKFVIGSLYNLVRFIKTASGHNQKILHASILKNIAKRFLYPEEETEGEAATSAAVNASLLSKLKQSSGENWSIVFDNIPRVISLVDEVDKVNLWDPRAVRKPFTQEEILRGMHVDLFDTFSEVQSKELASKAASMELITDLNADIIDLERFQLNSDLVSALYEYSRLNKPQLAKSLSILRPVIRVHLLYLDLYLLVNKKTLRSSDDRIEAYQNRVGKLVRLIMSHYENLDSIHEQLIDEYFWYFSFDHRLWFNSSQWILQSSKANIAKSFEKLYSPALRGAIRFEDMKTFDALYQDLWRIRKLTNSDTLNTDARISRDYLNVCYGKSIRNETRGDEVTHLLSTWSDKFILPNNAMVTNLLEFIRIDQVKSRWRMQHIAVDSEGRCLSTGDRLSKVNFDSMAISNLAARFRLNFDATESIDMIKELQVNDLERMESLLSKSKFDFVIDGMNIGYLQNHIFETSKLEKVLGLLEKEAALRKKNVNVLIVLKEHVLSNTTRPIYKSLLRRYDGKSLSRSRLRLNLFFASNKLKDDHFSIYAALKSGAETKIVTNDFFANHWQNLDEHGVLFRRWIVNRRVMVHPLFRRLDFPPVFEMRVTPLNQNDNNNRWIVPYYIGTDAINYNFKFFKYYFCEQTTTTKK